MLIERDVASVHHVPCGDIPDLIGIDGVGFRGTEVDATFSFVLKFLSLSFLNIGESLATEGFEISEVGLSSRGELIG